MVIDRIAELRALIDAGWHDIAVPPGLTLTVQGSPNSTTRLIFSEWVALAPLAPAEPPYLIEVVTTSGLRWRAPTQFTLVFG